MDIADGGIQHGSIVLIEDLVSNQHCSLTIYHQALDDILEKYEDGYIVLNPEVVPMIIKTKEEEQKEIQEEESESSDSDLSIMDDDDDDCEIVEIHPQKRENDSHDEISTKKQKVE